MGRVRRRGPDATLLNSIKKSSFIVTVVSAHKWILSSGPKWTNDILQLYKFPYMEKIDRDQKFDRRKIYKKYPFTQHFEILRNCIEIHLAWIHLSESHNYFVFAKYQYFSLNMLLNIIKSPNKFFGNMSSRKQTLLEMYQTNLEHPDTSCFFTYKNINNQSKSKIGFTLTIYIWPFWCQ